MYRIIKRNMMTHKEEIFMEKVNFELAMKICECVRGNIQYIMEEV